MLGSESVLGRKLLNRCENAGTCFFQPTSLLAGFCHGSVRGEDVSMLIKCLSVPLSISGHVGLDLLGKQQAHHHPLPCFKKRGETRLCCLVSCQRARWSLAARRRALPGSASPGQRLHHAACSRDFQTCPRSAPAPLACRFLFVSGFSGVGAKPGYGYGAVTRVLMSGPGPWLGGDFCF